MRPILSMAAPPADMGSSEKKSVSGMRMASLLSRIIGPPHPNMAKRNASTRPMPASNNAMPTIITMIFRKTFSMLRKTPSICSKIFSSRLFFFSTVFFACFVRSEILSLRWDTSSVIDFSILEILTFSPFICSFSALELASGMAIHRIK